MDFSKLQNQVAALLAPARVPQAKQAPETKRMTAEQFAAYADEQVKKAKTEAEAGKSELSKRRLTALHSEVTRLSKFEFKPSELPTVTVYHDPDQLDTTETERTIQSLGNSQVSGNHWTAKANELAKQLSEAIGELSNKPSEAGKPAPGAPAEHPAGDPPPAPADPKPGKPGEEKPAGDPSETQKSAPVEWPRDMNRVIRPHARDKDPDYDWGRDAHR